MKYTLTIDNFDKHTLALLNLIKTTDNVSLEQENEGFELSDAHKAILDERKQKHLNGKSKSYSWDEVKKRARSAK